MFKKSLVLATLLSVALSACSPAFAELTEKFDVQVVDKASVDHVDFGLAADAAEFAAMPAVELHAIAPLELHAAVPLASEGLDDNPYFTTAVVMQYSFVCMWLLKHNGKVYKPGDPIDLTDEEAAPFLASGVIQPSPPSAPADSSPDNPDESIQLAKVVTAIPSLVADNKEHFTAGGKPKTEALTALVGFDVNAAMRDAAWESFTANQGKA